MPNRLLQKSELRQTFEWRIRRIKWIILWIRMRREDHKVAQILVGCSRLFVICTLRVTHFVKNVIRQKRLNTALSEFGGNLAPVVVGVIDHLE